MPLVASPPDLRVSLGERLARRAFVRRSAATGGFVHSFRPALASTDRDAHVAWLSGCQFSAYCHNPDTWKLTNGCR